jgi:hypothetical protein
MDSNFRANVAGAFEAGRCDHAPSLRRRPNANSPRYTLIAKAKLNDINPQAWLADVLRRIADHPASRLHELLPWNWKVRSARLVA